jgi:DNA-binding response OmpR family regulator
MMFNLRHEGITADWTCDAPAMNRRLGEARYEVVVLDLGLPGEDGISIARRLEVSVNRLREKISAASGGTDNPLKTERLRGYRFTAPLDSTG